MKLRAHEKLGADPPPGYAEWSADLARELQAQAAEGLRQYHELTDPVRPELEAAITELGELEPWTAVDAIRKIRAAQTSRAAKVKRNRPSPYASEFRQWRVKAAAELALHDDADVRALAAAIKHGTGTKTAERYLREWVRANLAAITKQAGRAIAARVRA